LDDLIVWAIEQFGWGALVVGVIAYLIIEGGLDIAASLITDWIRARRKNV